MFRRSENGRVREGEDASLSSSRLTTYAFRSSSGLMSLITHLTSLAQLRTLLDAKKDKLVVRWVRPPHLRTPP